MKEKISTIILVTMCILSTSPAWAKIGVGLSRGKIEIAEPLAPGESHKLPAIGVVNTGDESTGYEMSVTYHSEQQELRPPKEWFSFSPQTFQLEGGNHQVVEITLDIPREASPGAYFVFIEAHPIVRKEKVAISIAAAAKTYFTVKPAGKPANPLQAIWRKVLGLFRAISPSSQVSDGVSLAA